MSSFHADLAVLPAGVAADVLLVVDGDRFVSVTSGVPPPAGAQRLPGITLPGLVNAHSHAFHRVLRGRTDERGGDFWSWRRLMYEVAGALDPDSWRELATAVFGEMVLAGITTVGEFHYVHHSPGGVPYADPNAMGLAVVEAAEVAGIRLTLLDSLYRWSGFGDRALEGVQTRFGDASPAAWAERAEAMLGVVRDRPAVRFGAAVHSVRAVDTLSMTAVAGWARDHDVPIHLHLSEQPVENEACRAATGLTPTALVEEAGVLGRASTAVHATHVGGGDIARLGTSGTHVCFCPTTERDLGDGVGPAAALVTAGSPLCLGTDSQAMIDLFEEARAVELDARLVSGLRGVLDPALLLRAATSGGAGALGWPEAGRLEAGALADFVSVALDRPRLAGAHQRDAVAQVVFAATAADVDHVVVGGRMVVRDGRHVRLDVGGALAGAIGRFVP